jgi:hypothetical protein
MSDNGGSTTRQRGGARAMQALGKLGKWVLGTMAAAVAAGLIRLLLSRPSLLWFTLPAAAILLAVYVLSRRSEREPGANGE